MFVTPLLNRKLKSFGKITKGKFYLLKAKLSKGTDNYCPFNSKSIQGEIRIFWKLYERRD
jgi:hypothetical protein